MLKTGYRGEETVTSVTDKYLAALSNLSECGENLAGFFSVSLKDTTNWEQAARMQTILHDLTQATTEACQQVQQEVHRIAVSPDSNAVVSKPFSLLLELQLQYFNTVAEILSPLVTASSTTQDAVSSWRTSNLVLSHVRCLSNETFEDRLAVYMDTIAELDGEEISMHTGYNDNLHLLGSLLKRCCCTTEILELSKPDVQSDSQVGLCEQIAMITMHISGQLFNKATQGSVEDNFQGKLDAIRRMVSEQAKCFDMFTNEREEDIALRLLLDNSPAVTVKASKVACCLLFAVEGLVKIKEKLGPSMTIYVDGIDIYTEVHTAWEIWLLGDGLPSPALATITALYSSVVTPTKFSHKMYRLPSVHMCLQSDSSSSTSNRMTSHTSYPQLAPFTKSLERRLSHATALMLSKYTHQLRSLPRVQVTRLPKCKETLQRPKLLVTGVNDLQNELDLSGDEARFRVKFYHSSKLISQDELQGVIDFLSGAYYVSPPTTPAPEIRCQGIIVEDEPYKVGYDITRTNSWPIAKKPDCSEYRQLAAGLHQDSSYFTRCQDNSSSSSLQQSRQSSNMLNVPQMYRRNKMVSGSSCESMVSCSSGMLDSGSSSDESVCGDKFEDKNFLLGLGLAGSKLVSSLSQRRHSDDCASLLFSLDDSSSIMSGMKESPSNHTWPPASPWSSRPGSVNMSPALSPGWFSPVDQEPPIPVKVWSSPTVSGFLAVPGTVPTCPAPIGTPERPR